MLMRLLLVCLMLPLALAGCGADHIYASDAQIAKYRYVSDEPPSMTLFTVIGVTSGAGGHSALMINGRERIIFDPAGTWNHPWAPERNDVHYGITEKMRKFYIDYHSRKSWYVRTQKVPITMAQADQLMARVESNGSVGKMLCADSVSSVLRDMPWLKGKFSFTFSPLKLSRQFGELPGVVTKEIHDNDPDDNSGVLMIQQPKPKQVTPMGGY
ncbi:hypothetical protein SAMN05216224_101177 [Thioclava dalianensis]|nr:hypothetical protein [Thioclava dalianensis]SFM75987.1 hypothetical protein SAMN05216224_101177 [Thioclava dalianensis]